MIAVAAYTLLEMTRRKLLWAFALIAVGLIAIIGVAPLVVPGSPQGADRILFLLEAMSQVVGLFLLLSAFAIGMTVINHDLDSGVVVGIFAKPVARFAYATAKVIAATLALLLIAAVLSASAMIVLVANGGGYFGVVATYLLATAANGLVPLLLVMALTVYMNNIIAAIIGFIFLRVVDAVVSLHTFVVNGFIRSDFWAPVIKVAYWIVPHQLVSDLPRIIITLSLQLHPIPEEALRGSRSFDPYANVPPVSGAADVVFWAAYVLVIVALLYLAVRRKQV